MDIRNYFSVAKKSSNASGGSSRTLQQNKSVKRVIDSDDEDPLPPKKKATVTLSDSDDDLFVHKATPAKENSKKKTPVKPTRKSKAPPPSPKPVEKCDASSFFSSAPVMRKDRSLEKSNDKSSDSSHDKNIKKNDNEKIERTEEDKKKVDETANIKKVVEEEKPPTKISKFDAALSHLDEKKSHKRSRESSGENSKEKKKSNALPKLSPNKPNENSPPNKLPKPNLSTKQEVTSPSLASKVAKSKDTNTPNRKGSNENRKDTKNSMEKKERTQTIKKEKDDSSSKPGHEAKGSKTKKTPKKGYTLEIEKNSSVSEPIKTETPIKEESSELNAEMEKKRQRALNYQSYLNRGGPRNPGSKVVPEGKPGCLAGSTFVMSGVCESLDKTELTELIQKYGGKVTTGVSRKTTYLLLGEHAGESKTALAKKFGTKIVSEDDLLEMIKTRPGSTEEKSTPKKPEKNVGNSSFLDKSVSSPSTSSKTPMSPQVSKISSQSSPKISSQASSSQETTASTQPLSSQELSNRVSGELMWVDKYKPASLKNVIGQQGDRSNAKKLFNWLKNWFHNQSGNKKLVKPSPWAKDHDGSFFKAALLSGSPGVGKTTTAQLVCKELGYDTVELNASDTRSKRSLTEEVAQLLGNTSLSRFAAGERGVHATSKQHVLLMDEVDGMAGSEDRGGVQELIQLLKNSKIPIICMCNDRQHPKIRSLANYCFDLRFQKPRIEQIRGAMMSVCFREGIKLKPDALDQIIIGSNQDVRQVLHHLSMFSAKEQQLDSDKVKQNAKHIKKDFKIGPWDVCRQVFSDSDRKNMNIHQKADLFFNDYSIGPLFVQQNYWRSKPKHVESNKRSALLKQLAKAANSIADGDLIEKEIRKNTAWSLLPTQAIFSCVLPGEAMSGHLTGEIEFPSWLGNNSRRSKMDRLSQELQNHTRLKTSGNKTDMSLEYGRSLRDLIVHPLLSEGHEGVSTAVEAMNEYCLLREDLDSLAELTRWGQQAEPFSKVESKVKAAFTRALNKSTALTPYSVVVAPKKKRGGSGGGDDIYGEEEGAEDDDNIEDDEDITADAMIKVKKQTKASTSGETKASSKSKDAGRKSKKSKN